MPHFVIETNADGSIRHVWKDGKPHMRAVVLEQHFSIVKTYFKSAAHNLDMLATTTENEDRRFFGLQSFLMSMAGLEAFTNVYFQQRAEGLNNAQMLARIEQSHGSITRKITELIAMSGDGPLRDQEALIERLWELSQLRNEIVHPRYVPANLTLAGPMPIFIRGMVENRQALFEDADLCRNALNRCLLFVARIAQSLGVGDVAGFMFHWTGNYGLTLGALLEDLGLPAED